MNTGLAIEPVRGLSRPEKVALAEWHAAMSGSNEGRLWLPGRIRRMPLKARLQLATDTDLERAWRAREIRRVVRSPVYFTREYGSVQPEEGEPIPFDLWPEQRDVLTRFERELRLLVLKARQLGLTWLALHYAVWLMAYNPATPNARVLALSKKGADADKLLERARKLNDLLPPFLSSAESYRTRESRSRFRLRDRGSELVSLMGTPEAARMETATLVIADEFAHYPNLKAGPTWKAVQPTLGERGRAIVIFTGNGRTGNGAAAYSLYTEHRLATVFLPNSTHPARRREGWREEMRRQFLTDEDFEAEYPETEEQAFAGHGTFTVYPHEGIAAAETLGGKLDAMLGELARSEGVEWGIDWGDFQTFALYAVPLGGGGAYVFDELVLSHVEPAEAAERIIYRDPAGVPALTFAKSYADAAPAGTNRTFARVLREAHGADPPRFPDQHLTVPFGTYKEGGGDRRGVNTVAYIRHLLMQTSKFRGEAWEASGVLAISPRCKTLLAQMRNLERDAEKGKVKKPALDPRHVERGDHGADALVALLATRAKRWRASVSS